MSDLFPELINLKGGPKQAWITAHLSMIWDITEEVGFNQAAEIFHMKPTTLVSALQRAEKGSFPAVTNGKRALAKSHYVENLAYDIQKQMNDLRSQFTRSQQATMAALELIERVLLMLRLNLTGERPAGMGKTDIETGADKIYVMKTQIQSAPLSALKSPTTPGLLTQAKGKGASLSKGQKERPNDKDKCKPKKK